MGSLVAAVASFLQAKSSNGQWLLRIEDLDQARTQKGATDSILRCLEAHGLHWDQAVSYQLQRQAFYAEALQQLINQDCVFYCNCSRRILRQAHAHIYPGTCRTRRHPRNPQDYALRIQVPDQEIAFQDALLGWQSQNLAREVGDFVIRRADQVYAYQLAVVVDDQWQHISEVVRGADLLDNTARQIFLQRQLSYDTPQYMHVPIVRNKQGEKLSKQTGAKAVDNRQALTNLLQAMAFLGQAPAAPIRADINDVQSFWQWAIPAWKSKRQNHFS
jgi:glutamyl-Q tRNA(Asp) synthetase